MAGLLHSESRRLYSWWWDSHISPKNSKWLQENLTDMDSKVKAMIKLIEEDADSFARRAEMYYKKRPELMKLVEEFYRAYRALAERYDHATVELRQAHRTMAEAFPNQVPFVLSDDSPSGASGLEAEPHTPEMPHPIRALFDPEDLQKDALGLSSTNSNSTRRHNGYSEESNCGTIKRGLKQLNDMFRSGVAPQKVVEGLNMQEVENEQSLRDGFSQLSSENQHLKNQVLSESERACQAEKELQALKKILEDAQTEKTAVHLQYQQSLEKLSSLERDLSHAQTDAGELDERASKAEIEITILKEALLKLGAERDAALLQYNQCLERISTLEMSISKSQQDAKGLNERAYEAEIEAQNLKQEISRLQAEKEADLLRYEQCLMVISALEKRIAISEENALRLNEQTERAEAEVKLLKEKLSNLNKEKEAVSLQYEKCLEKIAKLESEISRAQEDAKRLSSEVLVSAAKLKSVEEQRVLLERSNQSLQSEADNLAQKIAIKDQELLQKQSELEKLEMLLQDEHLRFVQVEATIKTLQQLHSQSQEEQRSLTSELQNRLQMLKELEISNHNLEDDMQRIKQENQGLNELNDSSTISLNILRNEISCLKEMKEKLDGEVALQVHHSISLQEEVYHLQDEIKDLSRRHQALMEQVQSVGLNPEFLESSVKELRDKNSKLIEVCNKHGEEKDALYEKLKEMDNLLRKNALLEISLAESNAKLEGSKEQVKELQQSSHFLREEKSALVAEKATLLSQLQIMTENMQKLLEKNTLLEHSLSGANSELESLRASSKSFEEFCQLLKSEKSILLNERDVLVSQLKNVEERLGNLENRFTRLEEKYADLEKEKECTLVQVEELRDSLVVEKQVRASYVQSSESRLTHLENHVDLLQEECKSRKREFEEELDRAVNAQVEIFILQKFIEDLEQKNLSLLVECQKHVEASKLSNKLITELESENLEQQVEADFLLDEIEKLRAGIYQVFWALQGDAVCKHRNKVEQEEIPVHHILGDINDLKCLLSLNMDEKQQLLVENSVLLCLLGQLRLEGAELESEKRILENDFQIITLQHVMLQKDKHELMEMNRQLKLEVRKGEQQEKLLKAELKTQHVKLGSLQEAYLVLQEDNSRVSEENRLLLKKFSELKEKMCVLEEENDVILQEAVALDNMSLVFQSFGTEKAKEVKAFAEDLNNLQVIKSELRKKVELFGEKLNRKEADNQDLNEKVEKLHKELVEVNDLNFQLNYQILIGKDFLRLKEMELSEEEQKLKATHNLNAELCSTVEELKRECEQSEVIRGNVEKQILELSESSRKQREEIEDLGEVNKNLKSEVCILQQEIEEQKIREEYLSSELQEKSNEFELWEAEAASFYFDLHVSAIHEVLLKNKVQQLTGLCESLEIESAAKSLEIEQMKERVGSLESEVGGLKVQLSAYVPLIASVRDNIDSLERSVLQPKLSVPSDEAGVELEDQHYAMGCQEHGSSTAADGISSLREMQTRLKAIETAVVAERERLTMQNSVKTSINVEALVKEPEELNLRSTSHHENDIQKARVEVGTKLTDKLRQQKTRPEISETRNGLRMKDIPLDQISDSSSYRRSKGQNSGPDDQMLELWESAEQDCDIDCIVSNMQKQMKPQIERGSMGHKFREAGRRSKHPSSELQVEKELGVDTLEVSPSIRDSNQGGNKEKILERLASDVQKLMSLRTTVQDLKKKAEMSKRRKKANDLEYERVKGQLQEAEEAIIQLVDMNDHLTKDIEESLSPLAGKNLAEVAEAGDTSRKIAIEQARKGSEKIGRLQFEVQNIEYLVLKLEDKKKYKGKSKFSESRTGVLLRDLIYHGGRKSERRKKSCFCGCTRSSTNEE